MKEEEGRNDAALDVCMCFFGIEFWILLVLMRTHATLLTTSAELISASLFFPFRVIIHPQFRTPTCEVISIPRLAIEKREKRNYVSGPLVYASLFFSRICYLCVRKKYFSGNFYRNHACRVSVLFFLIQAICKCRLLNALEIYFLCLLPFLLNVFLFADRKKGDEWTEAMMKQHHLPGSIALKKSRKDLKWNAFISPECV